MSPVTAITLLIAASGVLLLVLSYKGRDGYKQTAAFMATAAGSVGSGIIIGYLHGTPYLYTGNVIPMALPSAIAFVFLGLGLITASGPDIMPVRAFVGETVRSRLMRAFIPIIIAFVLVEGLIYRTTLQPVRNPALLSSLIAFLSLIVVGTLISKMTKSIGGEIDRGHAELMEAEENIRQLNGDLEQRNAELDDERARLERLSYQNKLILESAGEGIWGLDTRGFVTFVNKAAGALLCYEPGELIGKHSHSQWHHSRPDGAHYPSGECPIYRTYKDGFDHSGEEVFWTKEGTPIPVDFTSRPLFEGDKVTGAVVTFKDITGRKQAEKDRERLIRDLERSNKELEQFAYVASHDLQEPLRMVASYVRLISQDYGAGLDSQGKKYMDFAVDGALRMQKLIEGLLAYSRIGRRGAPFMSVDMNRVFSQALSNLSVAIRETQAVVEKDDLPEVWGDETQLVQLLQNLIGNGIKFRKPDSAPLIYVAAKRNRDIWAFSVNDNGVGIEPEYYDRVFLIFQRLHTREEYPGTGIGLALCKRIVERHHGRIWVESVPGGGTTFFFTLPSEVIK